MAVGPTAYLINRLLDHALRAGQTFTAPTNVYLKMHTGDPGATGASNASAATTRILASFAAAAGGVIAMTGSPEFTLTATETITHISVWDTVGPTGGNCLWTAQATVSKGGVSGDIIRMTALSLGFTGLAA